MLDIIIAIPLICLIIKGWSKGFIAEVATLVGVVAGGFAAVHFSQWVAEALNLTGEYTALVAFFITFIGIVVVTFLLGKCLEGVLKMTHLSLLNRVAGAMMGMLSAVCIVAVLLNTITIIDKEQNIITPEAKTKSRLYTPVHKAGNLITHSLSDFVAEKRQQHTNDNQ